MATSEKRNPTSAHAHAREATATPIPLSSSIAAWVHQLPTPPQFQLLPSTSKPLTSISLNVQRIPRAHEPTTAGKCRKRRAVSPLSPSRPQHRRALTSIDFPKRRSARIASLQSKYQHTEEEMDASSNGHAMATRGRPRPAGAVSQPQVTFPQLNGAQIPQLHPSTTSGNSASTAMSSSRSPRKSRSPTKSRSRSPTKTDTSNGSKATSKKEQLAYSEPMITYEEIKAIKDDDIPESVSTFWKNYIVPVKDEQKVIPEALKGTLQELLDTPMKTRAQVPESSYGPNLYEAQDVMRIHALVKNIVELAEENRGKSHEPHWVSTVVGPLITFLDTLPSMMSVHKKRRIKALNISSVSIQPRELCPSSAVFGILDKKIDHALGFEPSKDELRSLQRGGPKYCVGEQPSINQTYAFAFMFMFLFLEVKVDGRDPLMQLGVWIAAELEKRSREGYPMDVPIPAVAIYGDDWYLWIACAINVPAVQRGEQGKAYRVQFMGPIILGSTYGHAGVYKIFHVLKAVIKWGLEVYQQDYVDKVLAKY